MWFFWVQYWLYSQCGVLKNLLPFFKLKAEAVHLLILSNGHEAIQRPSAFASKIETFPVFQWSYETVDICEKSVLLPH